MKSLTPQNLFALSTLALLAACGGGSDGGSSSSTSTTTTPASSLTTTTPAVVSTVPARVTSVPPTTYTGEELAAFNLLNAERQHCGFGLLAQNTKLDVAARGHSDWLVLNHYTGHYQVAGTPGFTGVDSSARVIAAGYNEGKNFTGAEVVQVAMTLKNGHGEASIRNLATAPYHSIPLMTGNWRDVGIGVRDVNDLTAATISQNRSATTIEMEYTTNAGPQILESKKVRTYPCDGSTGVKTSLNGESPSPVPERNFLSNPTGSNIVVVGDIDKKLTITSASIINTSSGAEMKLLPTVTADNNPNKRLASNEAFILSDTPFAIKTAYSVNITGTNDGAAFSNNFTFTTDSSNSN